MNFTHISIFLQVVLLSGCGMLLLCCGVLLSGCGMLLLCCGVSLLCCGVLLLW